MKIIFNNRELLLKNDQVSIKDLLEIAKIERPGMGSVQVNEAFVDQAGYDTTFLKENDIVDFIYFMGGGN